VALYVPKEAILSKLSAYVLDPAIVEGAIVDALAELRPENDATRAGPRWMQKFASWKMSKNGSSRRWPLPAM
jgi:hypothetical protein